LRDLTEVHRNTGKLGAKARRKIAGAKSNNFGILRRLRWYRPTFADAPHYRITSASRPIPVSVIIAGFLFSPGPLLVAATTTLALRIDSTHGEEFVELSGATIRAVSRGVIGISLLQAVLGGIGMSWPGFPAQVS
jgi:hypothetical protein